MNHASLSLESFITKVIRYQNLFQEKSFLYGIDFDGKDAFWVQFLKRKLRKLIASPLSNNLFVRKEAFSIEIFG